MPRQAQGPLRCLVRTRLPTALGTIYVHLYETALDGKQHLALVVGDDLRSRSLDEHLPGDDDHVQLPTGANNGDRHLRRLVRGAAVGTSDLPAHTHARHASCSNHDAAVIASPPHTPDAEDAAALPLVRLHSECFTGETLGSVRCDCGDQLQSALAMMHREGRGVLVYLRQEGRGIGLLDKLRAYNLQDLGHDTVTANLLLNHPADMRSYDVAAVILRDLDVHNVRLLTNNPDKMEQLEKEGIRVAKRVGMTPSHWHSGHHHHHHLGYDERIVTPPLSAVDSTSNGSAPAQPRRTANRRYRKKRPSNTANLPPSSPASQSDSSRTDQSDTTPPLLVAAKARNKAHRRLIDSETQESGFDSQNEQHLPTVAPPPPTHAKHHLIRPLLVHRPRSLPHVALRPRSRARSTRSPTTATATSSSSSSTSPTSSVRLHHHPPPPELRHSLSYSLPAPALNVMAEMDAYLQTKVARMRHIIDLPQTVVDALAKQPPSTATANEPVTVATPPPHVEPLAGVNNGK
ncbi:GTP cyclohydrolase II [Sorochytrium milnesiophthora]